ncbi:hypothetical protein C7V51_09720 [Rathayibacter iranicus]|uniref:Uncharacterized protein n=1 Tax=Rathayibacter iranicus TaxID=59737 RepID=A0AAD1EMI0_9MICO|nr:hypothetical protein C7V51_09720 [Rathayibacter iranicus]
MQEEVADGHEIGEWQDRAQVAPGASRTGQAPAPPVEHVPGPEADGASDDPCGMRSASRRLNGDVECSALLPVAIKRRAPEQRRGRSTDERVTAQPGKER